MIKARQIDYEPRERLCLTADGEVRLTGQQTRYKFSGVLVAGEEDEFAKIGESGKIGKERLSAALDGFTGLGAPRLSFGGSTTHGWDLDFCS